MGTTVQGEPAPEMRGESVRGPTGEYLGIEGGNHGIGTLVLWCIGGNRKNNLNDRGDIADYGIVGHEQPGR